MPLPSPLYTTEYGAAYVGNAPDLLDQVGADSIDLVMTSPPFALQREKTYGNVDQANYVDWLLAFCRKVHRVLAPSGSFVLDLGGAYQKGRPIPPSTISGCLSASATNCISISPKSSFGTIQRSSLPLSNG